jgi:uncharacterized membrane protein (DUF373 family)
MCIYQINKFMLIHTYVCIYVSIYMLIDTYVYIYCHHSSNPYPTTSYQSVGALFSVLVVIMCLGLGLPLSLTFTL